MAESPNSKPETRRSTFTYVIFCILVLVIALGLSLHLRAARESSLKGEAKEREDSAKAGPKIQFVVARPAPAERKVELLGETRPYYQATIYAKISGYLREIYVDNGDVVKQGQVLAIIESPELDRQYDAAVEDARNKELQAKRGWVLVAQKATSLEDAQNRETSAQMARANAQQLLAQKEYETIRAPISGVITARFADPGALVQNATTTQTAALPVVNLSQIDRLKVFVYSDQRNSPFIKLKSPAEIRDITNEEVKVPASVSRTSVQLNPRTRTLLIEVDVDNRENKLTPGSFVRVVLTLKTPPRIQVPAEALVFQEGNPMVAVITDQDVVNFRQVVIAFSDGKNVRVGSGIKDGERVALNPGAGIAEGDHVRPEEAGEQEGKKTGGDQDGKKSGGDKAK